VDSLVGLHGSAAIIPLDAFLCTAYVQKYRMFWSDKLAKMPYILK
jgi:hypothetical protein